MGKAGFLTPKAIGNRIKAKGLLKLKFYCQMCEKQCRDDNGFKCHLESESHMRQMEIMAENPDIIDGFSKEFEDAFMALLSRAFNTRRVKATKVWNQYIAYKEHTHLNSTKWQTLTEFVKHLGKASLCKVDYEEEDGKMVWYISWIDRSPDALAKLDAIKALEKHNKDDNERQADFIQKQMESERLRNPQGSQPATEATAIRKSEDGESPEVSKFQLKTSLAAAKGKTTLAPSRFVAPTRSQMLGVQGAGQGSKAPPKTKQMSNLERIKSSIINKQKAGGDKKTAPVASESTAKVFTDVWASEGLVVKVVHKTLADGVYFNKKGIVTTVAGSTATVLMKKSGDVIRLDVKKLETVIPKPGGVVRIVHGRYKGEMATLEGVEESKCHASVRLQTGRDVGNTVDGLEYDDVCRLEQ